MSAGPGHRGARSTAGGLPVLFLDHRAELSGGERSLVELLAALDRRRIEPVLCVPADGALPAAARRLAIETRIVALPAALVRFGRGPLARAPWRALSFVPAVLSFRRAFSALISELRVRAVVTNSQKAHVLAALAPTRGVPLVWYFRDILPRGWVPRALAALARRRCAAVAGNSEATLRALFRGGPAPLTRVVRPGVAAPAGREWRRFRAQARELRARWRVGGGPVLVAPGQIARWKGQDVAVAALPAIRRRFPGARLVFVGDVVFPENEARFARHLHERSRQAGRCVVFAGRIEPIWPALLAADLVVHCARAPEPYGRVVVEAMAAGVPVVASRGGGPEEVLRDGRTGLLVRPDDPEALSVACVRVLSRRRLAGDLARSARRAAASETPARAARQLSELVRRVAAP